MNVALIGSGGREHAIAYKVCESRLLNKLYIIPGNPGTAKLGENINIDIKNSDEVLKFCKEQNIELVIIGPEQPLVDGLANVLRNKDIFVFGPDAEAAEIEADKSFAKKIMRTAKVPTANYMEFDTINYERAKEFLKQKKYPCVLKANGLAAGKGVVICNSYEEAEKTLRSFFIGKIFGSSGEKVLIEEFLTGEEASVFAITDGSDFICLPAAQDHKRIGDNDTGKNTGGMGAYSPAPIVTSKVIEEVAIRIIAPTLKAMNDEGKRFIGCLYVGLILTEKGPKVIEFNCRFGDPETQAVLPLLKGDFLQLIYSAAKGKLDKNVVSYNGGSSVCVVAASSGYPDSYKKGFEITGLDNLPEDVIVFHAGTKEENGKILTNGGRVLGVTSIISENDLVKAKAKAYEAMDNIYFKSIYYRKDIADKAIKN